MGALVLQLVRDLDFPTDTAPQRGVGWVLRWATTLLVLAASVTVLLCFAYQLMAENALKSAAAAGIREAVSERATTSSVENAVRHQLANQMNLGHRTQISLHRNGTLVRGCVGSQAGDQLVVSLSAPAGAALPDWLGRFVLWRQQSALAVRVESRTGP
jgi:hypothetical protein